MKRFILPFVVALLLAVGLFAGQAHAQSMRPLITCPHGTPSVACTASFSWSGGVRGAQVNIVASDPQVTCANGDQYIRRLELPPAVAGTDTAVYVGIVKCGQTAGLINNACADNNLSVFLQVIQPLSEADGCVDVVTSPTSDINHKLDLEVDDFTTNGGGIHVWMKGENSGTYYDPFHGNGICTGTPVACTWSLGRVNTFGSIGFKENLVTATDFTNHFVWGSDWTNNQYDSTSGNGWHYQSSSGNTPLADNPVQMGWHSAPNGQTNLGGTMYSCAYPSGTFTSCVLGS